MLRCQLSLIAVLVNSEMRFIQLNLLYLLCVVSSFGSVVVVFFTRFACINNFSVFVFFRDLVAILPLYLSFALADETHTHSQRKIAVRPVGPDCIILDFY